jgi:hypothetical protein
MRGNIFYKSVQNLHVHVTDVIVHSQAVLKEAFINLEKEERDALKN